MSDDHHERMKDRIMDSAADAVFHEPAKNPLVGLQKFAAPPEPKAKNLALKLAQELPIESDTPKDK